MISGFYNGCPVYLVSERRQRRIHKKKRINKKWAKKYGFCGELEKGKMVVVYGTIFMTQSDFNKLKRVADGGSDN